VYYLDDEPDLCELFEDIFSTPEIKITTFSKPKEAIEVIKKNSPDILFIDYRLPGITGDQIALQLSHIKAMALITGDLDIKPLAKFDATFEKPFQIKDIKDFINKFKIPK